MRGEMRLPRADSELNKDIKPLPGGGTLSTIGWGERPREPARQEPRPTKLYHLYHYPVPGALAFFAQTSKLSNLIYGIEQ